MSTANDGMTMEVRREWRKTKKGCWTMTLRLGTTSVRVTQRTPGGPFCRILYVKGASDCDGSSDGDQSWASLRTTDKALAQARAEAFLRALIQMMRVGETASDPASAAATSTVAPTSAVQEVAARRALDVEQLITLFMEAPRFQKLDPKTRYDYTRRAAILKAGLGPSTAIDDLDEDRLDLYAVNRRVGGIQYVISPVSRKGKQLSPRLKVTAKVRDRSIQADLKLLRSMILWALRKKVAAGRRLLAEDPIAGYSILEETSPRRPVATDERFQKTLTAIDRLVAETTNETLKLQYRMLRLAIISLDGTGRRISAILGLRWCDIVVLEDNGVRQPQIHFVRSLDKADRGAWLPLAQAVYDELMEWKKYCPPSAAGLVFPGVSDAIAVRSDWMGELLGRAEVVAGLAPLNGSLFHAYRRRFATAREHMPFNRVMELMGISDARVFRECYCRTSSDSLREALDSPRPVTDPRLELAA